MTQSRSSFDSESNFSLVEHGYANESILSGQSGFRSRSNLPAGAHGTSSDGRVNSYCRRCLVEYGKEVELKCLRAAISTIMNAASAGPNLATTLNNLNPLRPTGPKTGATRGKPATPIVLSELPKVSRRDFDAYIDSIKEDYGTWSRLQEAVAAPSVLEELDSEDGLDEEQAKRHKAIARALASSSLGQKGRRQKELPPLDSIPHIFFEENFSLANPRTFDIVTVGTAASTESQGTAARHSTDTIRSETSLTDFSTDQILQEKLTHYLDIVEVHLSVEISLRSASFFSALTNLQALDMQSAEALKQIALLKEMLGAVDDTVAKKGLQKVRQGVKRRRLNELDVAMERVKEVLRAVEQAEDLGEAGEIQEALDLADELLAEWDSSLKDPSPKPPEGLSVPVEPIQPMLPSIGEEEEASQVASTASTIAISAVASATHCPPVRIAKIKALSAIPSRLANLRSNISQTLESELSAVLTHELRETLETYRSTEQGWAEAKDGQLSSQQQAKESLVLRTATTVRNIVRCGTSAVDGTVAAWRVAMLKELKRILQELLPQNDSAAALVEEEDEVAENSPSSRSSLDGGRPSMDGPPSALSNIRNMPHEAYLVTMRNILTSMLGCLSIAELQAQAIYKLVSEGIAVLDPSQNTPVANDPWLAVVQGNLTDNVLAMAELANVRLARIVTSRAEVHTSLSLEDFLIVFNESWQFVLSCETICRKMIVGLRGVLVAQAKSFLQAMHQRQLSEAARLVEIEQWSPADVPSATQAIVERMLESAVNNPPRWELSKSPYATDIAQATKAAKYLIIEDRTYFAVTASIKAIDYLEEYLKVVINLPLLTMDAMSRIIEFLKQFNSRVCQVVLGAGAMRSAGLKNITAKHLALASQSLSIMISLIPYVRECLRRHLRAKQAVVLVDFDKLKRDYQEHQYEIHAKLVAIMGDRLAVHCKTLQSIDWEIPSDKKEGIPNGYMETLVKETATLHKVLHKYLPGTALETVMMQVLSAISSRLAEEYGAVEIRSDAARERILEDAKYMRSKFGEMKGLERAVPGAELEELVKMKKLEVPAPAPPAKPFTTPALTRSRTSFSHRRTPSSASASKVDIPALPITSAAATPDLAKAVEATDPMDIKTDLTPEDPPILQLEAIKPTAEVDAGVNGPLLPEMIPLPLSPVLAITADSEAFKEQEVHSDALPAAVTEHAPATPVKERENIIPPVPEKIASPPANSPPPPPVNNVKNRLAGLFNKRPAAALPKIDLPKIDLPKVSIPQLPHFNMPNLRSEKMNSPDRQAGSPAQAKSSLDLPRARALLEKPSAEQEEKTVEQPLPTVPEAVREVQTASVAEAATVPSETKGENEDSAEPVGVDQTELGSQDEAARQEAQAAEVPLVLQKSPVQEVQIRADTPQKQNVDGAGVTAFPAEGTNIDQDTGKEALREQAESEASAADDAVAITSDEKIEEADLYDETIESIPAVKAEEAGKSRHLTPEDMDAVA